MSELKPVDGTAVILHLIEAAQTWAADLQGPMRPSETALLVWVDEIRQRYQREKIEPAPVGWEPRKWRHLVKGDRVEVGGVEAEIEGTVTSRWHIDPRSNEYRPQPLEHDVTMVRLAGREQVYRMPPDGEVETLRGEYGRDLDAVAGYRSPLAEEVPDVMQGWAQEAVDTLAAAGLGPIEVKR